MKKRRRFIPPDKARAAFLGGFYQQIPAPEWFTCTTCGEQRHAFGQEEELCLKCRWTRQAKDRPEGVAA